MSKKLMTGSFVALITPFNKDGTVDFAAFRDVLKEINYDGWGTVEQDMYPAPFDKPLPIAKRTRNYLRSIGVG